MKNSVLRRAREVVPLEVMQKTEGWTENVERMNAQYEAPTTADAEAADASTSGLHGGNESTVISMYPPQQMTLRWPDFRANELLK